MPTDFTHLKPGDEVMRLLGNTVPMRMVVTEVTDTVITCNCADQIVLTPHQRKVLVELGADSDQLPAVGTMIGPVDGELWTFDRATGVEIDHDLQWGPEYHRSGSFLVSTPPPGLDQGSAPA